MSKVTDIFFTSLIGTLYIEIVGSLLFTYTLYYTNLARPAPVNRIPCCEIRLNTTLEIMKREGTLVWTTKEISLFILDRSKLFICMWKTAATSSRNRNHKHHNPIPSCRYALVSFDTRHNIYNHMYIVLLTFWLRLGL